MSVSFYIYASKIEGRKREREKGFGCFVTIRVICYQPRTIRIEGDSRERERERDDNYTSFLYCFLFFYFYFLRILRI